ncbi:MAG: hypothetical protein PHW34_06535 [Hespellia sp.]|nr:hypothetical protein [Hespellia sp.]
MIEIVDMHCHILPGVDDGAANLTVSKRILQMEYDQGVRRIIFTPHYRERYFETDRKVLIEQYYQVKNLIRKMGLRIHIHLGCECHCHEQMGEHLKTGFCLTMAKGDYVLIEFSSSDNYAKIRGYIYDMVNLGYKPIIAHIERYPCIVENPEQVNELIELGAYIQVNADSVIGLDGRAVKRFCQELMKTDQVHFIGSDTHNDTTRKTNMKKCVSYVERKMGKKYVQKIFFENPMKIINRKKGE